MYCLRGLAFTCKGMQHCQANKTDEINVGFNKAYENTLKMHHNFVVKGAFGVRFFLFYVTKTYSMLIRWR